jgi:hypothetical protein
MVFGSPLPACAAGCGLATCLDAMAIGAHGDAVARVDGVGAALAARFGDADKVMCFGCFDGAAVVL